MQAIDTQDNEFHDGNGTTELGTILPAWWLNQVQAELLAVITGAGIAPKRNERNQLQAALRHMMTQAKPADASGTTKGIVMLSASTSSTATDKAATPSAVKAA
ncbi:tail fiber protein, partial [Kingella kingae]|uniref:tail fiber protein n=1 Tax=Kingella kingae TaxID=504 RepID=UPI00255031F7